MFGLSPAHLIVILVILLIVVGPGRLPETGAAIGRAVRGFKDAVDGNEGQSSSIPAQPAAQPIQPMPPQIPPPVQPAQPMQPGVVQAPAPQVVAPSPGDPNRPA